MIALSGEKKESNKFRNEGRLIGESLITVINYGLLAGFLVFSRFVDRRAIERCRRGDARGANVTRETPHDQTASPSRATLLLLGDLCDYY